MGTDILHNSLDEHISVSKQIYALLSTDLLTIAKELSSALSDGGTLFWFGNGGSASDSQHLAAELVGRFKKNRRALRSIALNTDTSVLTCVANDYCYDDIFSRQIEALARPGDVLIGISTSGNSQNVLNAFKVAKDMDIKTVALLGKGGGLAKNMVDYPLVVPSDTTARIQEMHILIGHILCELIERELKFD